MSTNDVGDIDIRFFNYQAFPAVLYRFDRQSAPSLIQAIAACPPNLDKVRRFLAAGILYREAGILYRVLAPAKNPRQIEVATWADNGRVAAEAAATAVWKDLNRGNDRSLPPVDEPRVLADFMNDRALMATLGFPAGQIPGVKQINATLDCL